jgi:hypothetical protein
MKRTAKRLGNPAADPADAGWPAQANDSSQGSAIVTPIPRRTVRLDIARFDIVRLIIA